MNKFIKIPLACVFTVLLASCGGGGSGGGGSSSSGGSSGGSSSSSGSSSGGSSTGGSSSGSSSSGSSSGTTNNNSDITKQIANHQINGTGTTGTVDWLLSYTNSTGATQTNVDITDAIGAGQTYVANSEQHPTGWAFTQSGSQLVWNAASVGANLSYNQNLPDIDNAGGATTGTGDGYMPIPYYSGTVRKIFTISHHSYPKMDGITSEAFKCVDLQNNLANCAGFPKFLPDGDVSTTGITAKTTSTSSANDEFQIIGNKLYYAVTRLKTTNYPTPQDWGLGCYNVDTDTECGYWPYSTNPQNKKVRIGIEGPYRVGSKLYSLDVDMNVWCHDTNLSSQCSGSWPVDLSALGSLGNNGLPEISIATSNIAGHIGGRVADDKIYFSVSYRANKLTASPVVSLAGNVKKILCFDTTSPGICSNWNGVSTITGAERVDNFSNYIYKNTNNIPVAFCLYASNTQQCVDLSTGSAVSYPPVALTASFGLGREASVGTKSYFPSWAGNLIHCWNWSTQQACANGANGWIPSSISGFPFTHDYAAAVDKFGCTWFNGDARRLWSLDPTGTSSPCNYINYVDTAASPESCSGNAGGAWTDINVNNITTSDFALLKLYLLDATGNVLNGGGNGVDLLTASSNGIYSFSLNTAPYNAMADITYRLEASFAQSISAYTTTPAVQINSTANTNEFCYQTEYTCPTTTVSNNVTLEIGGALSSGNSATVSTASLCEVPDPEPTDIGINKKVIGIKPGDPNQAEFEISFTGSLLVGQSFTFEDTVAANSIFNNVSAPSPWVCTPNAPVAAGQILSCTITGPVTAIPSVQITMESKESKLENCVSITDIKDEYNSDTTNDDACDDVVFKPREGDIGITKKVIKFEQGEPNYAAFQLSFSGSIPAGQTVVIEDIVPANATFVSVGAAPWICSPSVPLSVGQTLSCELTGPFNVIPPIIIEMVSKENKIENCASITEAKDEVNDNLENDTDCDTVIFGKPEGDIGITKTAIVVKPGDPNVVLFDLSFTGSIPAGETVVIEDVVPPNSTFVHITSSPWVCTPECTYKSGADLVL